MVYLSGSVLFSSQMPTIWIKNLKKMLECHIKLNNFLIKIKNIKLYFCFYSVYQ